MDTTFTSRKICGSKLAILALSYLTEIMKTFIRHLKDSHAISEMIRLNAERGLPRSIRKKKWRILEENLLRMKRQFVDGERNLYSYWANVCYYVKEFIPRR